MRGGGVERVRVEKGWVEGGVERGGTDVCKRMLEDVK